MNSLSAQTTYTWNSSTGNWSDTTRWTPNGVPGEADTAIINGGIVTVDTPFTVNTYTFNGGQLKGAGTLTVTNAFYWSGGQLTNGITLNLQPGLTGALKDFSGTVRALGGGATLNNHGTLNWLDTAPVNLATNTWNNYGTLNLQSDAAYQRIAGISAANVFNNFGTLRKSAGSGLSTFVNLVLTNYGVLEPMKGTLRLPSSYPADSASICRFILNGYTIGTGYGVLDRGTDYSITGKLDIVLTNNFVPTNGAAFMVITANSINGTFGSVTGRKYADSQYFTPIYSGTTVNLVTANGKSTLQGTNSALHEGKFQLQITGAVNEPYRIDTSTDLVNWFPLSTNQIPSVGMLEYVDGSSPDFAHRFYRVIFVP